MQEVIYPALKAIIEKDRKILILKKAKTEDCFKEMWDVSGCKIKFGEMPEETNLEIEIIKPVRIWSFFKNENTQVFGVTVLCKYKSGEVKLSKEHSDFKWIKPEEIENYNIHEGIKEDVKAAFNF